MATAEGAELLGITANKLVMACTEIREVAVVSHNLQQPRAAEAGVSSLPLNNACGLQ